MHKLALSMGCYYAGNTVLKKYAVRPNRKKKGRKKESAIAQQDKNDYFADDMNQLQKDKKINWESLLLILFSFLSFSY